MSEDNIADSLKILIKAKNLFNEKLPKKFDTMVGENGPEIVDFKTAVNLVPAHRTQETLKTLGESGGVNIVSMDLPPIKAPTPEVSTSQQVSSNDVEMIPSVNPFNSYMVLTPEILKIS